MIEYFEQLVAQASFLPKGEIYNWNSTMLWMQICSNFLIGLAFLAIAITLIYMVFQIKELPFGRVFVLFGVFTITCGLAHFMDVWTIWYPNHWLDAGLRIVTAIASVGAALVLPALVPKAVALADGARCALDHGIRLESAYEELGTIFEKTKELEKLRSEFLEKIGHDLKTPLSSILGPAQTLLKKKDLPEDEVQQLAVIYKNASQIMKHVNELMSVSKLDVASDLRRSKAPG